MIPAGVWDKVAAKWNGDEEWSNKTLKCQNSVVKRDFVAVAHRPKIEESFQPNKEMHEPDP